MFFDIDSNYKYSPKTFEPFGLILSLYSIQLTILNITFYVSWRKKIKEK